jgi:hypothetical protein
MAFRTKHVHVSLTSLKDSTARFRRLYSAIVAGYCSHIVPRSAVCPAAWGATGRGGGLACGEPRMRITNPGPGWSPRMGVGAPVRDFPAAGSTAVEGFEGGAISVVCNCHLPRGSQVDARATRATLLATPAIALSTRCVKTGTRYTSAPCRWLAPRRGSTYT